MKRQEKGRRGWSEVRRKTGRIKKVGWEVKEKSETNWSWMTGSKSLKKERRNGGRTSVQVSRGCRALRLASYCKKLSWCYTNLPIMILASELACCVYDVDVLFKLCYLLHCYCCYFLLL